jgi:uncharacterized membrane protein
MWNIFIISIFVILLLFNSHSWWYYLKKTGKSERENEGWQQYHLFTTILLLSVLIDRIDKL